LAQVVLDIFFTNGLGQLAQVVLDIFFTNGLGQLAQVVLDIFFTNGLGQLAYGGCITLLSPLYNDLVCKTRIHK
jgi:hypothetical protein